MDDISKFGVLGAGAWGTALGCVLARKAENIPIKIWAREAEVVEAINGARENPLFLPDVKLPDNLCATSALADFAQCEALLMVVPSRFARGVVREAAKICPHAQLILCAKGLEEKNLQFMNEVAGDYFSPAQLAVLSGPSFANEVARGLPAAITLAHSDLDTGRALVETMGSAHFRLYLSDDLRGAEIGGVIKNVLAIACGIVSGKALGENARAAIIARGFAEMMRLGVALGAKAETLTGLCGLGDLILTCTSTRSRNFSLGEALGRGEDAREFLAQQKSVSEGALSARAVRALAAKHKVDMPICAAVAEVLAGECALDDAIENLLARPTGFEME